MKRHCLIAIIIVLAVLISTAWADNLFNIHKRAVEKTKKEKAANLSPISDVPVPPPPPIDEHDLVTVVIEEVSIGSSRASTEMDSRQRTEFSVDQWFHIRKGLQTVLADVKPKLDTDTRLRMEKEGSMERRSSLRTTVQAMVMQVYPNGNLLVEARSTLTMGMETQQIVLTGICRSADVYRGQISSKKIYDCRIVYSGVGPMTDASQPGWLTRFMNKVWPF